MENFKKITIPETVKKICKNAFSFSHIEEVTFPKTDIVLENNIFESCQRLKKVKILSNITSLPKETFKCCEKLEKVILPPTLLNIGKDAFKGCSSLKRIKLPKGLTSIDEAAFANCSELRTIKIPDGVVDISDDTFFDCISLSKVKLSPNTQSNKPLTQVNVGWGFNRLKQVIKRFEEKSENVLDVPESFQDAQDEQWVIYRK